MSDAEDSTHTAGDVYVLYNVSETIVLGVFDSLEALEEAAESLAESDGLELNMDLFGYVFPMNSLHPIGLDEEGLIELGEPQN